MDDGRLLIDCLSSFASDGYGNLLSEQETCQPVFDALPLESTLTTRTFTPDRAAWLISNPTAVTVTSRRAFGTPQTQEHAFSYDETGMLQTVTRAPNQGSDRQRQTRYARDGFGNVTQVTDLAPGVSTRTTTVTYDDESVFPETITNAAGHTTQVRFDARWGAPTEVADANGIAVQRSFDGFGHPVETRGAGASTLATYAVSGSFSADTAVGHIEPRVEVSLERVGAAGSRSGRTVAVYDNYGRQVQSRSTGFGGAEVIAPQAYDALGRLRGTTLPATSATAALAAMRYTYDHLHRVTRAEHADGSFQERQYATFPTLAPELRHWLPADCDGLPAWTCAVNVTLSVDEEGRKNAVITDHRGLVARSIDGENIATTSRSSNYFYGAFNRLTAALDNRGLVTGFDYDEYGRRIAHSDPDSGTSRSSYNGFDELTASTDPKGQVRAYAYDDLGRPVSITDPAGTTRWIYDAGVNALGRLSETISPATARNPDGIHVRYAYEAVASHNRGLVSRVETVVDGTTYPLAYDYDDLGRTERIRYPTVDGGARIVTQYLYDSGGLLTGLDEVGSAATRPLWRVQETFQAHLLQRETFGNGASTTYGCSAERRWLDAIQTTLGSRQVQSIEYAHQRNGLIHQRNTDAEQREYVYDDLNRLAETRTTPLGGSPVSAAFAYDDIGNITARGPTPITYQSARPHLVDTAGAARYAHDLSGNVTSRVGPEIPGGAQRFDYTPFDLPRTITTGSGASARLTELEYSADERRVVRRDPDITRTTVSDVYERVTGSITGETLEQRFRLYAGARQLGEIVRRAGSEETLYFHADALGSVDTLTTSNSGSAQQSFDEFGMPIERAALTRAGFTGHQHDDELGLIDMKGRIYDPLASQFTSADPVLQAPFWSQGLNRYSYVFNNPVNNVDPSGFISEQEGLTGIMGGFAAEVAIGTAVTTGFGGGVALGGLGVGFNIATSLAMGSYGGGSAGSVTAVMPSAAPASSGVGVGSMNATAQNRGLPVQWVGDAPASRRSADWDNYLAAVDCKKSPGLCKMNSLDFALSMFPSPMAAAAVAEPAVGLLGRAFGWLARRFGVVGPEAIAVAARFATTAERAAILQRVLTSEGGLKTSQTVARQLAGQRGFIPTQAILDTIGSGVRVVDPQGVTGQFMYKAAAQFNGSEGALEVLVDEVSGQINHVLFRSGVAP